MTISKKTSKTRSKTRSKNKNLLAKKISVFMKNTTRKRQIRYLKHICSSSGECLAFGREKGKIKSIFKAFTKFHNASNNIKRIGAESANGFIHEIPYEYQDYKMYTVLKSSTHANSDNLMYEYEAGLYVNQLNQYLPCFIETYGLFKYKEPAGWEEAKNSKTISKETLRNILTSISLSYEVGCESSKYLSLMIQHIKDAVTLEDMIETGKDPFFEYEILNILFQLYLTLDACKDTFTHYDLHGSNVLMMTVSENRHIDYVYHITDALTVKLKSKYMAKMIDYGRSYFKDTDRNVSSESVYNTICSLNECKPDCGSEKGFIMMQKDRKETFPTYVMSNKRNMTHDLRLIYYLVNSTSLVEKKLEKGLKEVLECFYSSLFDPTDLTEKDYQGEYNEETGRNDINNVTDLYNELLQLVQKQPEYPDLNSVSVGELHVYCNGKQMTFQKAE